MKVVITLLIVAALAGGGFWLYRHHAATAAAAATAATAEATAKVTRGDLHVDVASTGVVASNLDVDVKCKAGGQITAINRDISDPVKKGDLLVELDPVDQQRVVDQAKAQLAVSQAKVAVAQANLAVAEQTVKTDRERAEANLQAAQSAADDAHAKAERQKDLLAKQLVSQEDCDTAQTTAAQAAATLAGAKVRMDEIKTEEVNLEVYRQSVTQSKASVQSDSITLEIAQDRLADTKVVAPIDGVVSAKLVQVGTIIASATSNVGGGTTLLTLSDLSHIFVLATVDESDIGKVQVGQDVAITADAFANMGFTGKVVRIATTGVNSSNVVTFEVKIEVTSPNKARLKPQMTANVSIDVGHAEKALLVPAAAVIRKSRKEYVVDVKQGTATVQKDVEIGVTDGTTTQIVSGLDEGAEVVVHAAASKWNGARPGMPPAGMVMGAMRGTRGH